MALKNKRTSNVGGVQIHVESAYDKIQVVADNITELLALENHFKEMNGIYIGALSTNPTTRTDSSALQNGDHYYNSSSKLIYKYIDGAWIYSTVFYNTTDLNAAVGTGPFNVWIAYADTVNGVGISTLPSGKEYIGIANGKATSTVDTSDPSVFTWTDFKGDTGAAGSSGSDGSVGSDGNDGVVAIESPTIPANITSVITSTTVKFNWTPPTYGGHGYTKVYRAAWSGTVPAFSESYLIASIQGHFVDIGLSPVQNYRYWFRHVNLSGVSSALSLDVGHNVLTLTALEDTSNWISAAQLDATLAARLDKLDTTLFSINGVNKIGVLGALTQLDTNTTALNGNFNSLQSLVGNGGSGLIEDFNDLKTAYDATVVTVGNNSSGTVAAVNSQGAHYFLKHNVNGRISGFGLSSTIAQGEFSDGQVTSQFAVLADDFVIAHPATGTNANQATVPFRIVNGTTFIKEAIIEEVTAGKITAGTIATQNILIGSSAFNISGAAQGFEKGSLVVTGAQDSKVTLGYITPSTIGLEIKDVNGITVLDHLTLAADMRNASQQWSDVQGIPTGIVQTFYQANAPTSGISVGDYWIDSDDRKTYRLTSTSPSVWTLVQDQDIIDALANAATAQSTADGKVLAFYNTTPPTVDNDALALTSAKNEGDLWFDTDDGNKMYKYVHPNWVATDDTRIGDAVTAAGLAQDTADGKINSYYTTTAPTIISNPELSTGDFWVDTNASANRLYRWSGSAWVDIKDASITTAQSAAGTALSTANTAQDTADGKVVTFVQETEPTSEGIGDLWFDTSDENKLYRSTVANSSGDWVPYAQETADWTKVYGNDKPDDNATVGAIWGSTINGQPSDTALLNSNTTPTDIGFTGALNANYITNNNQLTNGSGFNGFTNTNQLTDGAGLGTTAAWGSVSGISDWAGLSGITVANASTYIASAAITNAQIGNLDAGKINAGYISAARIAANTINTNMIAADAITADKIVAGAITAGKLSVDSIVATNITADAITTAKINGSAVGTTEIANFAVTNIWTQSTGALNLTPNTTSLQSVCNITQTTTNQGDLIITAGVGLEMYVGEYDDFYITAYLRQGSTNLKVAKVFSRNRVDIHDSNQATVVTSLFIEHTITSPSGSNAYRLYLALTPLTGSNSTTYPTTFKRNWGSMKLQQVKK